MVHARNLHRAQRQRRGHDDGALDQVVHLRLREGGRAHCRRRAWQHGGEEGRGGQAREARQRRQAAQRQQRKVEDKKVDAQQVPKGQEGLERQRDAQEIHHVLRGRAALAPRERVAPVQLALEEFKHAQGRGWRRR